MSRLSWNEAAKNAWDERAAHWHANSVAMWKNGSRKDIIPFFKNHIPLGSVADLGCGDGYGSMLLNNEGYDVIGMDISEEMIRIATKKEQSSLSFVVGDLNKPPFKDEQFSAVMAINSSGMDRRPASRIESSSQNHESWRVRLRRNSWPHCDAKGK